MILFLKVGDQLKGKNVLLYSDRCIMCTRCVRFTREVTGSGIGSLWEIGWMVRPYYRILLNDSRAQEINDLQAAELRLPMPCATNVGS